MSAVVGDVVHNLRSALDCVALAACKSEQRRTLSEKKEKQIQFPITSTIVQLAADNSTVTLRSSAAATF